MAAYKVFFTVCVLAIQVSVTTQQGGICANSGHSKDGTGFAAHPYHCDQYIQCYYNSDKNMNMAVTRTCPTGLHWNATKKRCEDTESAKCKGDFCQYMCEAHAMKDNCRGYYECNGSMSVPKCCPKGHIFVVGKGCVEDVKDDCNVPCQISSSKCLEPECKRRPNWKHPGSFHYTVFGTTFWFGQTCDHNDFDATTCKCSASRGHKCSPDKTLSFTDNRMVRKMQAGTMKGMSTKGGSYSSDGITLGPKNMIHVDATSTAGNEPLTIKFRYRANSAALPANSATTIMSSNKKCSDAYYGTLFIYVHPAFVSADLKTADNRNDHVDVSLKGMKSNEFKEVTVVYDRGFLAMSVKAGNHLNVETVPASKMAFFPCGFDFGSTVDYDGFQGEIESISVSSCTPAKLY